MAQQDQIKWNQKYQDKIAEGYRPTPCSTLIQLTPFFTGKTCLDLACGLGGNSLFLAKHGLSVTALDISDIAVDYLNNMAKEEELPITGIVTDFDHFTLPKDKFDLIVCTYFLDRNLFDHMKQAVTVGGLFFMETFYRSPRDPQPHISKDFKLSSGELKKMFSEWECIFFDENEHKGTQCILARKLLAR